MATLYLSEPGSTLRHRAGRLRVERRGETLADLPSEAVDEVLVLGPAQVTTQAMRDLLARGGRLHLLTAHDGYLGGLEPARAGRAALLRLQVRRADDPAFALALGLSIVAGKLENARVVLARLDRARPGGALVAPAAEFQATVRDALPGAATLDELRGLEGVAAQAYFAALAEAVPPDWGFPGRRRRPPPDPVNSLLSFGYALLLSRVASALLVAGLHPAIGFLHVEHGARPALALDLMEEYRAALVDRLALTVVSRRLLRPEDFEAQGEAVLLGPVGRRTYLELFEARLASPVADPDGRRTTYRELIRAQARELARVLRGEAPAYRPLRIR